MLHTGSRRLAHQLDRFDPHQKDAEVILGTAAQLDLDREWVEKYLDLFGDEPVTVEYTRLLSWTPRRVSRRRAQMPAFEAHLRQDLVGERLTILH
jgi:hypothetical protein